ncbi:MAG TPA: hypothetical protein VK623_03355 [Flavobacterium sp.]|nr:hypothetical protein [Flavobacterium sp.]
MRKSVFLFMMALMSLTFVPSYANAIPTDPVTSTTKNDEANAARAKVLLNRLDEIKAMDKSEMSRSEKKALRKEVRAIKGELAATGNGIYLSIGAIIIIILLLILLL